VTAFDREGASTVLSGPLQITVTGSANPDTPPMGWLDWVANPADGSHVIPQGGNLALGGRFRRFTGRAGEPRGDLAGLDPAGHRQSRRCA
jgi:hypothetical protein